MWFCADFLSTVLLQISIICTLVQNIGFGEFGSFPVTLTAKASGKSEVYWK